MWEEAENHLLKDKYVGPLVKKHGPCTIKKRPKGKYFSSLVSEIVGQQLSGKAAMTIFGRLEKELGGEITPDNILRKRDETLRKCGLSYAKISYIKDLSRHVKEGKLHLSTLDKHTDDEVFEELVAVKGIGRWTADMFLMFVLARPDIFPLGDLGISKGFKLLTKKDLKSEKMGKFAECWKPYRTVASWYIWRNLDFLTFDQVK